MKIEKIRVLKENLDSVNKPLLSKDIKRKGGIYFLYDENLNLLYIGQTANFRGRLLGHLRLKPQKENSFFPRTSSIIPKKVNISYFSFIPFTIERDRHLNELILIKILEPKYNYTGRASKLARGNLEDE